MAKARAIEPKIRRRRRVRVMTPKRDAAAMAKLSAPIPEPLLEEFRRFRAREEASMRSALDRQLESLRALHASMKKNGIG